MDLAIHAKIINLDDAMARIEKLDVGLRGPILKSATRAGAKQILISAKALEPQMVHNKDLKILNNLKVRSANAPAKGIFRARVGLAKKDWPDKKWFGSFLVWGHRAGKRNQHEIAPRDFLDAAAERAKEGALRKMVEKINKGVDKVANG